MMHKSSKLLFGLTAIILQVVLVTILSGCSPGGSHSKQQSSSPYPLMEKASVSVVAVHQSTVADRSLVGDGKCRWKASVEDVSSIHSTPDTLLVMGYNGLTAIKRQEGKPLWKIEALHTDKSESKLRTIDTNDVSLVGVSTSKRQPQIAVILSSRTRHVHNEIDYKTKEESREASLRGIELGTGKELWHSPLEFDAESQATELSDSLLWYPLGVYGQTIVLQRYGTEEEVRFQDALTGAVINPEIPKDRAFLRESAVLFGERHAWADFGQLIQINPKAEKPFTLLPLGIEGNKMLIGRIGNRLVYFVSTDDGYVGHSVWPNFLVCCDVRGKKLWQFPKHIPDKSDLNWLMKHYDQVEDAVLHPQHQRVFVSRRRHTYILNGTTGKIIQKLPLVSVSTWQCYKKGYVVYNGDAGLLSYRDGATGKILKNIPMKLGRFSRLFVVGQDLLFAVPAKKKTELLCYSGPTLLGQ